jgi:hypothetical protein
MTHDEFHKQMLEKYPKIFSKQFGGFAVGEGWYPIIESLCENIQTHTDWQNKNRETRPIVEQVVVVQIKEKFGSLRFYYQGGDEAVAGMVRMAESWAIHSCEVCGDVGTRRRGGWVSTLCDVHENERQEKLKNA